jgi:UDP-N-acetylglucosamine 2-epimerase (non-hydrolysing)
VTLHRPSNVDNKETFQEVLDALLVIAREMPIFFPAHPRTMHRIKEYHFESCFTPATSLEQARTQPTPIRILEPLGYLDFLCLMAHAKLVLTDSGGLQEETTALGIPCVTLRHNTERPITITHGTNVLAGTQKTSIIQHAFCQLTPAVQPNRPEFWDGHAGERIVKILAAHDNVVS